MKYKLVIASLAAVFSINSWAIDDTPQNREREAIRYEQTINMQELMDGMFGAATDGQFDQNNPVMPVIMKFMQDEIINIEWLKSMSHQMYVDNFTAQELKALADFYGSPEGQSTMKKLPNAMKSMMVTIMPEMQKRMQEKGPMLEQRIKAFYAEHPELKPAK